MANPCGVGKATVGSMEVGTSTELRFTAAVTNAIGAANASGITTAGGFAVIRNFCSGGQLRKQPERRSDIKVN